MTGTRILGHVGAVFLFLRLKKTAPCLQSDKESGAKACVSMWDTNYCSGVTTIAFSERLMVF